MTNTLATAARPTIDFSGSGFDHETTIDRRKARAYAADLVSRVNKPETNRVLEQVADGGTEVDAYLLAEAVLDAMRHVATRFGQSMQRRREGEKAAHLGYIAHAVIASHADGLPAYEPGARSRQVEELRLEVEHAGVVNQSLTTDLGALRDDLREAEQRYLAAQRRAETAEGALAASQAAAEDASRIARESAAGRDSFASALDYALGLLPYPLKQRVLGYLDAVSS